MAATPPVSRDVLNRESNARFWSQTGFKPGQKLDPKNPTDKAMMPVWMDIFRKVKAEADAGTLVTTYDHPVVDQSLSDAAVADKVTAMHVDAAARATDPRDVQANAAAAATAAQVLAQRLRDAVARQPSTVSPALVQDAAEEAARTPPPPHASAGDQIAHAQVQAAPLTATAPDRRLIDATNELFWQRTGYKPGQKLDMSIAEDRRQAKVWMEIYREVQREASAGGSAVPSQGSVSQPTFPLGPPHLPPPLTGPSPMQFPTGPSPMQFPAGPSPIWPQPPMGPRPSMGPRPGPRPPMGPQRPPMGPQFPPPGGPAGGPITPPEMGPGAPPPAAQDVAPSDIPSDVLAPAPKRSSILKYVAIGVAVIAGGGLIYYAGSRKPARGAHGRATRIATPSFEAPSARAWRP